MAYLPFSTQQDGVDTISASLVNNLQTAVSDLSYNVQGYGATGDGSTDDTTALQAAIDAANTAGGGIVFFPEGTYISTLLTMYSKVQLIGAGRGATVLKLKDATNTALIQGDNYATLAAGDTTGGISDWSIQGMSMDGNIANNGTTGYGIRVYGYRYVLRDLDLYDFKTNHIVSQWASASSENMEAYWENVRCHKTTMAATPTTGALVEFTGPHDSILYNCQFFYGTDAGFKANHADKSAGLMFSNCHVYGDYITYGFDLVGNGCMLNTSIAEAAISANIRLQNNNQQVKNCYIGGGPGEGVGIEIDGASGYHIANNTFVNCNDGAVKFTSDGGGLIAANNIFGDDQDFPGTADITTEWYGNRLVGTVGAIGAATTIDKGIATPANGIKYGVINGEGSAADDLTNIVPLTRKGTVQRFLANHALTLKNYWTPTGTADAAVTTTDTTLTDTRLALKVDAYIGQTVTCNGKTMTVTSNTATTFTGTGGWSGGGNPGNGFAWDVTAAGKIITGTGGDLAVGQYGVLTIISDDPNWIVI